MVYHCYTHIKPPFVNNLSLRITQLQLHHHPSSIPGVSPAAATAPVAHHASRGHKTPSAGPGVQDASPTIRWPGVGPLTLGMGCQDYSKLPKRPAVGCRIRGKCHPSASSGSRNSGRRCGEEDRGTCQGCCGTLWEGQPWLVCTGKAPRSTLKGKIAGIFPMDMSSFCLQQVFYDKGGQVAIPSSKRSKKS